MKSIFKIITVIGALSLTACGGGGSNTGASTATIEDGIWNGQQTLTIRFSSGGTKSDPSQPDLRIHVVDGEAYLEKIKGTEVTGRTGTAALQGNQFSVTLGREFTAAKNTTCKGSQIYTGTLSATNAKGTIKGKLDCTDDQGPYQQFLTGNFTATKA